MHKPHHLVVMGVAGVGKSTIANRVAEALGRPMAEADDFHSDENIAKMIAGSSLTTSDREPWLTSIRAWMDAQDAQNSSTVVACSALRRSSRERLSQGATPVTFVHLVGPADVIRARMQQRSGHFMPASLLDSQFLDLEPLEAEERGFSVDALLAPDAVVAIILDLLAAEETWEAGMISEGSR